jgi:hypothetical protein
MSEKEMLRQMGSQLEEKLGYSTKLVDIRLEWRGFSRCLRVIEDGTQEHDAKNCTQPEGQN